MRGSGRPPAPIGSIRKRPPQRSKSAASRNPTGQVVSPSPAPRITRTRDRRVAGSRANSARLVDEVLLAKEIALQEDRRIDTREPWVQPTPNILAKLPSFHPGRPLVITVPLLDGLSLPRGILGTSWRRRRSRWVISSIVPGRRTASNRFPHLKLTVRESTSVGPGWPWATRQAANWSS